MLVAGAALAGAGVMLYGAGRLVEGVGRALSAGPEAAYKWCVRPLARRAGRRQRASLVGNEN